jgi:L1 cell adhesion molecule like protein
MISLGLDFGTSNTCISYINNKIINIITNQLGNYTTPSCLYFDKTSDEILYGETALEKTKGGTVVTNFKRLFGITYTNYSQNKDLQNCFKHLHISKDNDSNYCCITVLYNNKLHHFTINKLVEMFLSHLLNYVKNEVLSNNIVITVPVEFDINQRQMIKTCLQNIGYNTIRILNEPTAATLAYIYHNSHNTQPENEKVLVIDSGGGTTDCTLLDADYENCFFEVIKTNGDKNLGGNDITNNLTTYIMSKITGVISVKNLQKIYKISEKTKHNLSFKTHDKVFLENIDNKDMIIDINRRLFETINNDWFHKFKLLIQDISDGVCVDKIIFVGGTTRIPKIKEILLNHFDDNIIICNRLNPDHTVSMGGAVQTSLFNQTSTSDTVDITFLDTISMSLGVETIGGIMSPIISKNSIIPTSKTEHFLANPDESTLESNFTLDINVYQGERRFVKDNLFIGTIKIPCREKNTKFQITFDITSDSILVVTVRNPTTQKEISMCFENYKTTLDTNYTYEDDFDKLNDIEQSNLITAKIELNNSFELLRRIGDEHLLHNRSEYEDLLNETLYIIENYKMYDAKYINDQKILFEKKWHTINFVKQND